MYKEKYKRHIKQYGKDFKDILDEEFLKRLIKDRRGYELNLEDPKTFNEKIQWLKLYNKKEEYKNMVDKVGNRHFIKETIGEEYLVGLLGVWDKPEDIEWEKLPNQFVLKCNHDSGSVIICKDKSKLDKKEVTGQINWWLKRNYFHYTREWVYKDIKPKVLAEEYLEDEYLEDETGKLVDYKVMCFNGEPKFIQTMSDREYKKFKINHYDTDWNEIDIPRTNIETHKKGVKRPKQLEEILEISKKLSKGIPLVRVDLYIVDEKVYFGEMTFYPAAGTLDFKNYEDELRLGEWITLPEKKE